MDVEEGDRELLQKPYALDVFLEGDEVAHGGRLERRQQPNLGDMGAGRSFKSRSR